MIWRLLRTNSRRRRSARQLSYSSGQREGLPLLHSEELRVGADAAGGGGGAAAAEGTALLVHGLLGQGRNLRTFASSLFTAAARRPGGGAWTVALADLRAHGRSAALPLPAPHTLTAAAADVVRLAGARFGGAPDVLIGHSLGGKIVLEAARQLAAAGALEGRELQVWMLDSLPGSSGGAAAGVVADVLAAVAAAPATLPSREALHAHLAACGVPRGLQLWLGGNLKEVPAAGEGERPALAFQFDLGAATELYRSYRRTDGWALVEAPPPGVEVRVVRALGSGWPEAEAARLRRAAAPALEVAGDHWLHASDPGALAAAMLPHLARPQRKR